MTHTSYLKQAALGAATAIAVSAATAAYAAPAGIGGAVAVQNAAPSPIVDVRHRHRGRYVTAGVVSGLAVSTFLYGSHHHYGPHPGAVYYNGPPERCWVQNGPYRGQGRWVWC